MTPPKKGRVRKVRKVRKVKKTKAHDVVKEWLKANFKSGDPVEVLSSENVLVISRARTDFVFSWKADTTYKPATPPKRKRKIPNTHSK